MRAALAMAADHPVLGVGVEHYPANFQGTPTSWAWRHVATTVARTASISKHWQKGASWASRHWRRC